MEVPLREVLLSLMLERMRMYHAAVGLNEEVQRSLGPAKEKAPNLADHLERSANSVLLSREGWSVPAEVKITAYDIAPKKEVSSALRCAAWSSRRSSRDPKSAKPITPPARAYVC
jgi:hypothetical protein